MKQITRFSKILRLRNSAKKLQQLSWTVSQLEKRFDLDELPTKDYKDLIRAYIDLVPQLELILDELKAEDENKNSKT